MFFNVRVQADEAGAVDNEEEDIATVSRRSGDADVGLMALWGLLNLSGYEPAQVKPCMGLNPKLLHCFAAMSAMPSCTSIMIDAAGWDATGSGGALST